MKKIKTVIGIALCATMAASFSACSLLDTITEPEATSTSEVSEEKEASPTDGKTVDESIPEPTFVNDLDFSTVASEGSEVMLDGTAQSSDGGEITYQWYVNNVDSNGGGTAIEGATEAVYTVDSSETGFKYYYVVASNSHEDSYNMAVSSVSEVKIIPSGEWATDEFGGTRYMSSDGTYPANVWVQIGNDVYSFDSNGYRAEGWKFTGESYIYFDENGVYQADAVIPEGIYVDEAGNVIVPETAPVQENTAPADGAAADPAAQ